MGSLLIKTAGLKRFHSHSFSPAINPATSRKSLKNRTAQKEFDVLLGASTARNCFVPLPRTPPAEHSTHRRHQRNVGLTKPKGPIILRNPQDSTLAPTKPFKDDDNAKIVRRIRPRNIRVTEHAAILLNWSQNVQDAQAMTASWRIH